MEDCKCSQCDMRDQCDNVLERRMKKVNTVMAWLNECHEMQERCKILDRVDGFKADKVDPEYLTGQRRTWFDSDIPTTKGDK